MAEQSQANQAEILRLFLKYVPCGVAMFDRQMRYLMASQRWVDDYRLESVESIIGRSHYEFFPDLPERWQQIHQRCLAGTTERCEADCFERLDGSAQWIRWEVRPWYQASQKVGGIILFAEDITERRQAEISLKASQQQLQRQLAEIETIYRSAPIGLNVLDTDLRFVRINQRLAEINGLSVEDHIGHTIRELLPDLADAVEQVLRSILETGEPLLNVEISGETPAQPGVQRTWLESFLPLKDGDRMIGISTVCEEITERKHIEAERQQTEKALRQIKEELESRVAERTAELQIINRELQQREEQLRLTLEFNHIGSWDWDVRTGEVIWNDNHFRLLGLQSEASSISDDELYQLWRNAIHPEDVERVEKTLLDALHQHQDYETEYRVIYPDSSIHWLVGKGRGLYDAEGEPIRMLGVIIDVSDRKQAEQILELQAVITRNMAEGICLVSAENGNIVYANPKFEQMFGYDAGELNGKHVSIVNYATKKVSAEDINQAIRSAVLAKGEATYEVHNVKKDGTPFWCSATTSVMEHPTYGSVLVAVQQDISDRKQAQEQLEASLKEKEVLLKEIHHRVKNNLGIVSSLLQMQARRTPNDQVNRVLRDSQNRIASIALVHEKLYRSEDLANINFTQYIQDLTVYLFDSYNINSQHIELNTQVEDIDLDIDTAIPCGLIINELVSNALKYAFPDEQPGKIQVRFEQSAPIDQIAMNRFSRVFTLTVQDNGVGLPADLNLQQSRTLGMSLVKGLVKQIKGTIEISSQPGQGATFTISFTKVGVQNG